MPFLRSVGVTAPVYPLRGNIVTVPTNVDGLYGLQQAYLEIAAFGDPALFLTTRTAINSRFTSSIPSHCVRIARVAIESRQMLQVDYFQPSMPFLRHNLYRYTYTKRSSISRTFSLFLFLVQLFQIARSCILLSKPRFLLSPSILSLTYRSRSSPHGCVVCPLKASAADGYAKDVIRISGDVQAVGFYHG